MEALMRRILVLALVLAGCAHAQPAAAPNAGATVAAMAKQGKRVFHRPQTLCPGGNTTIQTIGGTVYINGPKGNTTLQTIGGTVYVNSPGGNWTIQSIGGTVYVNGPKGNTTIQAIGGTVYVNSPEGNSTVQVIGGTQYISGAAQEDLVWDFVTLEPSVSVQIPPITRLTSYFSCNP
jgi:hypothetical protein